MIATPVVDVGLKRCQKWRHPESIVDVPCWLANMATTCRPSDTEMLSNWHLYAEGDRLLVDHVGRYESLD